MTAHLQICLNEENVSGLAWPVKRKYHGVEIDRAEPRATQRFFPNIPLRFRVSVRDKIPLHLSSLFFPAIRFQETGRDSGFAGDADQRDNGHEVRNHQKEMERDIKPQCL